MIKPAYKHLTDQESDELNPNNKHNISFDVYLKVNDKPEELSYDLLFELPNKELQIWDLNDPEDVWKIFIDSDTVNKFATNLDPTKKSSYDVWYVGIIYRIGQDVKPKTNNQNKDENLLDKNSHNQTKAIETIRNRRSLLDEDDIDDKESHDKILYNSDYYAEMHMPPTGFKLAMATPACRSFNETSGKWESNLCKVGVKSSFAITQCICKSDSSFIDSLREVI